MANIDGDVAAALQELKDRFDGMEVVLQAQYHLLKATMDRLALVIPDDEFDAFMDDLQQEAWPQSPDPEDVERARRVTELTQALVRGMREERAAGFADRRE